MGGLPLDGHLCVHGAHAPQLDAKVRRLEHQRQIRLGQARHRVEHLPQLVGLVRPLLPRIGHQDETVGSRAQRGVLEGVHGHGQPRLHVAGTAADHHVPLDARGDVVGGRGHHVGVADQQDRGPVVILLLRRGGDDGVGDPDDHVTPGGIAIGQPVRDRPLLPRHAGHRAEVHQQGRQVIHQRAG